MWEEMKYQRVGNSEISKCSKSPSLFGYKDKRRNMVGGLARKKGDVQQDQNTVYAKTVPKS